MRGLGIYAKASFLSKCKWIGKQKAYIILKLCGIAFRDPAMYNISRGWHYPITMAGVTYEDTASLLAAPFEAHLDEDSIEAIRKERCTDMFCNYAGIMMGNGEVWIGEVLNEDYSSAGLHVIGLNILKSDEAAQ